MTPIVVQMISNSGLFFLLVWLTTRATFAAECPNFVTCPCGSKGENVRVCVPATSDAEVCTRLSKCETCEDGFNFCSKCPQGLEGPFCSREIRKNRQKRQTIQRPYHGYVAAQADYSASEVFCGHPGPILNGRMSYFSPGILPNNYPGDTMEEANLDEYEEGSMLQYSCDEGFSLQGSDSLTCQSSGFWSSEQPECVRDDEGFYCENPGLVLNGKAWYLAPGARQWTLDKEMDEYPAGSVLKYICDKSFRLQGSDNLTCDSVGFWSAERPSCVGDCGQAFVHTDVRNRDDTETMFGEWPWVVSISVQEENGEPIYLCGGALINTHAVITIAHLIEKSSTYILRFGKHRFRIEDDDPDVLIRTSSRIIVHPDFSVMSMDSDISLILFEPAIEYSVRVQPICLPTLETTVRNIQTHKVGYVSSWSETERDLLPEALTVSRMAVLSSRDCIEYFRKENVILTVSGNMFCALNINETNRVCRGGSGSPFAFYDYLTKRYTLEGLVSFRTYYNCSAPGEFVTITKVFRFLPWIYQNME